MNCGGIFDFNGKKERLVEVLILAEDPSIWQDSKRSQELGRERKTLEGVVLTLSQLHQDLNDTTELFELALAEHDDASLNGILQDTKAMEQKVADMEFRRMFSKPMDSNNCFLDIQSGSGGTEAQDWASMLLRMYLRYCENKNFRWTYWSSPMVKWQASRVPY